MKTTSPISSVSSSTLIDAKLEEHRVCRSNLCPSCGQKIDPKPDWIGLPAGVKFDPTDQELIEHLEAKVQAEDLRSHPLIDEFIPTLEGEDGICYTHPEKLPGVTRDGLSKHFFHRPSKAYTTGTRKRRKIQSECDLHKGETRWHKTGKTRPVMANGKQKGCKKILVLYTNFGKHRKPEKTNWVMHQYHLGELEEEKEGELVVSKIFYQTQPRQCNLGERSAAAGAAINAVAAMERRKEYSGTGGSCSSSKDGGHMRPPDNFSFAPFRESFNEVAMGEEAAKEARRDEHGEEEHRGKAALHQLAPPAAAAAAAAAAQVFHITRAPISNINVVSGATPPLQLSPLQGLEDPYRVSRMLFQADKSQHQQQQLQPQRQQEMDSISAAGLEELVMSCTTAGVKGEASINPHSQETEWQYSYSWSPDNPDHHG